MQKLNYPALSQFTFDDLERFMNWLRKTTEDQVSLRLVQIHAPIRFSKLGSVLIFLEICGFISRGRNTIHLSTEGLEFSEGLLNSQRAILRGLFLQNKGIRQALEALRASPGLRLTKRVLREVLMLSLTVPSMEFELQAVIAWAGFCDLFHYDRAKEQVYLMDDSSIKNLSAENISEISSYNSTAP